MDSREPTIDNLVELIFGPKSNIGRLLQEKLEIGIEELLKQLGIFSLAAAYILSKMQMKRLIEHRWISDHWQICLCEITGT